MNEYWVLRFPNNTYAGPTATSVLKQLSKAQWDDESRSRIKRALAWRTWVATHEMLNEWADDDTFLRAFCTQGMATLEVTTDDGTEIVERTDWS